MKRLVSKTEMSVKSSIYSKNSLKSWSQKSHKPSPLLSDPKFKTPQTRNLTWSRSNLTCLYLTASTPKSCPFSVQQLVLKISCILRNKVDLSKSQNTNLRYTCSRARSGMPRMRLSEWLTPPRRELLAIRSGKLTQLYHLQNLCLARLLPKILWTQEISRRRPKGMWLIGGTQKLSTATPAWKIVFSTTFRLRMPPTKTMNLYTAVSQRTKFSQSRNLTETCSRRQLSQQVRPTEAKLNQKEWRQWKLVEKFRRK